MSTDEQAFEDAWEDEVEAQPPDKCPACGGNRFGSYLWGMVIPDDEIFRQMNEDEVRLAGCIVSDEDAFWFCRDCDADILEEGWLAPDREVARELERLTELLYDGVTDEAGFQAANDKFQEARKRLLDPGTPS